MKKLIYIAVTTIIVSLLVSYNINTNKKEESKNNDLLKTSTAIEDKNKQIITTDEIESTIEFKKSIEERKILHLENSQNVLERVEKYYKEK